MRCVVSLLNRAGCLPAAFAIVASGGVSTAQTPPVETVPDQPAVTEGAPAEPPAPPPGPSTITLTNGDVLKAPVVAEDDAGITVDHPALGRLTVPRDQIKAIAPPEGPKVDPDSFFRGWTGSAELGLNGASGNTERFGFRGGLGLERLTTETKTNITFSYVYGTEEGDKSEDKGELLIRNDWLPQGDSRWRPYAFGRAEYDTFQDWDWRLSAFGGIGYELVKTERTLLIGRVGAGVSKEIGGSDNRIVPEGNLGLDFDHKFTDTQRFTFNLDVFPSLLEFGPYRATAKAAYEVVVDPTNNLALKLGVQDDYDSDPQGKKRNDFTYFALMVVRF